MQYNKFLNNYLFTSSTIVDIPPMIPIMQSILAKIICNKLFQYLIGLSDDFTKFKAGNK